MKKIILKKKIVEAPLEIQYIPAIQMEDDVEYVNQGCTTVLKLKRVQEYDGAEKGIKALHDTRVYYTGLSSTGDILEGHMPGNHAVMCGFPELIEQIKHSWGVYQGRIKAITRVATSARPPKLDKDGKPLVRQPRGEKDSATGCIVGTTGHEMGKIMLETGWDKRVLAVEKMTKWLEQQFDPKKAKALAQSWYSTNMLRKSEIYGNPNNYKGGK